MTDFYRTEKFKVDSSTFGGEIGLFDFYGHHTMKTMADKIMGDLAFDYQCKKNIELRDNFKKGNNQLKVSK